jgi:HD-like signal output (HDOD) protein
MNINDAAQQVQAQNATRLILEAINRQLISVNDANNLTEDDIGEISIFQTVEEVGIYVFRRFHETIQQRNARRIQEQEQLRLVREEARREVQDRADARANTMNGNGGKRRRRRTRKFRKR